MTYSLNIFLNIRSMADGVLSGIIDDSRHSIPGPGSMVVELPIPLPEGLIHGFVS